MKMTGNGLPEEVLRPTITLGEGECVAKWDMPAQRSDEITNFILTWSEDPVYEASDFTEAGKVVNNVSATELKDELETQPNRRYQVSIEAVTCAGRGDSVTSEWGCETEYSAPEEVPTANVVESSDRSETREIVINLPSQTNGPVTCALVIVSKGQKIEKRIFNDTDLDEFESRAASGEDLNKGYLSIAISREEIDGASLTTNLGTGTPSSCDASNITSSRSKRDTAQLSYTGVNRALDITGEEYWFLTITTTPREDKFGNVELLFQQSDSTGFYNGQDLVWITGAVLGFVAFVALIVVFVIWRRRNSPKNEQNDIPLPAQTLKPATPDPNNVYENMMVSSDTEISVGMLQREYELRKANDSMHFREQYQELRARAKRSAPSAAYGSRESSMAKNRYKNIIPYDHSRVSLQQDVYINACFVKKGNNHRKFIAAQGPLPNTVNDFWRMVVEQRCEVIVMLTKCEEGGRKKCEKYWPNLHESVEYGGITVENQEEYPKGGYIRRELKVYANGTSRLVNQFQYWKWPDHGVPATTSIFFRLHADVMKTNGRCVSPMLVHCSAGVGRTGTFIGYDILRDDLEKKKSVDVFRRVLEMRQDRVDMVQTCDQYELLHKLLLERYLYGETDVNELELAKRIRKDKRAIEKEFVSLSLSDSLNYERKRSDNGHISGPSNKVVILRQPEDTEWITIDATFIEGYNKDAKIIAAQGPLRSTVEYFWRAIYDNEIGIIVMLNQIQSGESNDLSQLAQYWPNSTKEPLSLNNMAIRLISKRESHGTVHRQLQLERKTKAVKIVNHFQYLYWPELSIPTEPSEILDLLSSMRSDSNNDSSTSVFVHCSDGLGRTGAFCAVANLVERIRVEQKIDVFRTVKDLRDIRPGMVRTLDQYMFCYEAAAQYLTSTNTYENVGFSEDPIYQNMSN